MPAIVRVLALAFLSPGVLVAQAPLDCTHAGAVLATSWPHPTRPQLVALLCRHDPLPGWWDSLWLVETRSGRIAEMIEVPLYGTGVDRFAWLDCPGLPLAHVVDRTHMGTLTDQVLRIQPDGRVEVVQSTRFAPGTASARTQVSCP